jgi:plastocyanin
MVLALVALPAVNKATAAAPAAAPTSVEIKIDNFSFTPATLTVKVGTQITWVNADDIPHTIVSANQSFKSKVLDTDEKFTFAADKPGTYSYFCSIHPKMTGKSYLSLCVDPSEAKDLAFSASGFLPRAGIR